MAERALPRGRHGLSRDQVVADQRARMMLALAEAMAADGYVGTSVKTVLTRAGVSRETFYQQFSSKLDCFLQTFDAAGQLLLDRLDGEVDRRVPRARRAERALGSYLEAIASEPAFARLFLVESYAAGPAAIERRAALQARMADRLAALLDLDSDRGRFACRTVVAAVATMVTVPLVAGDVAAVRALHAPLLDLVEAVLDVA